MNLIPTPASLALGFNVVEQIRDLCRVCESPSNNLNSIFDDHGCAYDLSSKMNAYLPIKVSLTNEPLPCKVSFHISNAFRPAGSKE